MGAEIARSLHAAGARVALHYRHSAGEAEALAAAFNALRPDTAFTVKGDLARFGAAEEIAAQVLDRGDGLDGLVNNASSFFPTPVGSIDRAAWDELMGSNLMGPLFLSQALAPALRAAGGAIVNIVDIHAERPLTGYTVYNVAKGGLATLTRALAIDLAPEVRVNGVHFPLIRGAHRATRTVDDVFLLEVFLAAQFAEFAETGFEDALH